MALPIPGSSVSVTGTPRSTVSGVLPGDNTPNLLSGIPSDLNWLIAFSAVSRDSNTPVTTSICSVPPVLISVLY
jgi:hypothetical protein